MIYLLAVYLLVVNIAAFVVYVRETESPSPRISFILLFGLPVIGGSLGAILANYFFKTEYREVRAAYSKFVVYIPPVMLFIQIAVAIALLGPELVVGTIWNAVVSQGGIVGGVLLVINVLSFILVALRKSSRYFAPIGLDIVPDVILIPFIVLGAIGATLSKVIFNFGEDWSTNAGKGIQNFLYNNGMFVVLVIYVAAFVWAFYLS